MPINRFLLMLFLPLLIVSSGCTLATVRSLEDDAEAKTGFNPANYVASIWDTEFVPTMEANAVDISQLLVELDANEEAATEQYGNRTSTGPYSFMTRGEARIITVNRESRVGLAELDLSPFDGTADIFLAIGPVLRGNALRDAVGFIQFNDFTNQVEFAQVSDAMKERIDQQVLTEFNIDDRVGATIRFLGAFTFDDRDEIVIIPIRLEEVSG